MQEPRGPRLLLVIGFLAAICAVGPVQAALEAARGRQPVVVSVFTRTPTDKSLRTYEQDLEDTSWVSANIRPWVQYTQLEWLGDAGSKAICGRDGWIFYRPSVEYLTRRPPPAKNDTPPTDPAMAIVALRDRLAERGIRLLVVPAPNKESVYPNRLTSRAESFRTFRSDPTRRLMDRLRAAGVETLDLLEVFDTAKASATPSDAPFYLARDTHWSPAGAELAARAAGRRILDLGWVAPGRAKYNAVAVSLPHTGDLLRMLQAQPIVDRVPPEMIECHRVVSRETGEPLHDDPASRVLVLGDSFLRIYETDEPGAAGFIAHLAMALGRPVATIVNDGGASTLVRQDLARRPALLAGKKVVVWEFAERDITYGMEGWQDVPLPPAAL
jgi:hypothetical protein